MRAVVQTGYGSADVIDLRELDRPTAGQGEVLVQVRAASLAAGEYFGMRGSPFVVRFYIGFPNPKKDFVVGLDLAGVVEAVGSGVTQFQPGDEVFGEAQSSCAEYAVVGEDQLVSKPANLTFEQAAAVPTSGQTALTAIRDQASAGPGKHVLINGASGGVGPFAVQIAKALGAEVTGVCSTRNVDMVREIGADHVIDYTQEDFTKGDVRYDAILDNVASHTLRSMWGVLEDDGVLVPSSGHAGLSYVAKAALCAPLVKKQGPTFVSTMSQDKLGELSRLIEDGKVRPIIDREYPLEQTRDAFAYLDEGHARGKVVIRIGADA
jgi:NADPH:quinone reductase-like Zn-dependent oxidoreductase